MVVFIYAIFMIVYYIYVPHKNVFYDLLFKVLSSLGFLLMAVVLFPHGNDITYMKIMLAGFILGTFGDVFLALPFCYPKKKDLYFLLGLSSFLLGHLAFTGALFHTEATATMVDAIISILGGILIILILKRLGVEFASALIPSTFYAIVILFMECQAISYLFTGLTSFSVLLNIGSLAFVLSDLVLVFILFGHKDTRAMTRLNLTLYYFAQMSLVFTFLMR